MRMLGGEAVVDCDDRGARPRGERPAERVVRLERADRPAAAVQPDERPGAGAHRLVHPAGHTVEVDILDPGDLLERAEQVHRVRVDELA